MKRLRHVSFSSIEEEEEEDDVEDYKRDKRSRMEGNEDSDTNELYNNDQTRTIIEQFINSNQHTHAHDIQSKSCVWLMHNIAKFNHIEDLSTILYHVVSLINVKSQIVSEDVEVYNLVILLLRTCHVLCRQYLQQHEQLNMSDPLLMHIFQCYVDSVVLTDSHKIRRLCLKAMNEMISCYESKVREGGTFLSSNWDICNYFLQFSSNNLLYDWDQGVRKLCLLLLSNLVTESMSAYLNSVNDRNIQAITVDDSASKTHFFFESVLDLLKKYTYDRDARVRSTAISSITNILNKQYQIMDDSYKKKSKAANNSKNLFDLALYQLAVNGLQDSFQQVREKSMELIYLLSTIHPTHVVVHGSQSMPLVEDAFAKLCTMVRDTIVSVRTLACSLLGRFAHMSNEKLLLETFSKMTMNYHQPAKRNSVAEFDTISNSDSAKTKFKKNQKKTAMPSNSDETDPSMDDVPDGDVVISLEDTESDSLLYTGVVGTFVLALEDQFQSVRLAAVTAIQEICSQKNKSISIELFARTALSHLINMFSDDIDQVRQISIEAVAQLGANGFIILNEEQLQIILVLLEDQNASIRFSMHKLLGVIKLSNATCLHAAIRALLTTNLTKYPEDLLLIYKCLQKLGKNHAQFVELLVEELLRLERYLLLPEQSVDDLYYTGILIVIMNAMSKNSNIIGHLPRHVYSRHYEYLKSKYHREGFFPDLNIRPIHEATYVFPMRDIAYDELANDHDMSLTCYLTRNIEANTPLVQLNTTLNLIRNQMNKKQLDRCYQSIRHLSNGLLSRMSLTCYDWSDQFYRMYSHCLELYIKLLLELKNSSKSLLSIGKIGATSDLLRSYSMSIIYLTYKLETLFSFTNDKEREKQVLQLKYWRFFVHLLMNCHLSSIDSSCINLVNYISIPFLRSRAIDIQKLLDNIDDNSIKSGNKVLNEIITKLLDDLSLQSNKNELSLDLMSENGLIYSYFPLLQPMCSNEVKTRRLFCKITSPESNIEKPYCFLSFVPLEIVVKGVLYNYHPKQHSIYIAIRFPDDSFTLFPLKKEDYIGSHVNDESLIDFIEFGSRLSLSMESWTFASSLHITVLCRYSMDSNDEYLNFHISNNNKNKENTDAFEVVNADWQVNLDYDSFFSQLRHHFIPICNRSIEYLIHPQEN